MNSEQDFAIIKLSERVYIANSSSLLLFQSRSRETLIRSHSKGSLLRAKVASFIGIVVSASAGLIIRFPFNCLVMRSEQQRDIFRNKFGNIIGYAVS